MIFEDRIISCVLYDICSKQPMWKQIHEYYIDNERYGYADWKARFENVFNSLRYAIILGRS